VLLHELAHVDADQVLFAVEQEARQRLAQLGLAHAGGAEEQEGAVRPVRVGQARARAADGVGHGGNGLVLADHALVQLVFHLQQLVALALHHLGHRDAGGADTTSAISSAPTWVRSSCVGAAALRRSPWPGLPSAALFQLGQLAVLQLGHLVEVALALSSARSAT
jgi:hypothetical protein